MLALLAGCALHASLDPPTFDVAVLYSQVTSCPGTLPPPLPAGETARATAPEPAEPCTSVQVGAKTYTESITALGSAIVVVVGALAAAGLL